MVRPRTGETNLSAMNVRAIIRQNMGKAEVIAALVDMSPEDRAEVQAKLDELAADEWQDHGELSEADKHALDAAIEDYERNPDAGSSWDEVKDRIQSKLRP